MTAGITRVSNPVHSPSPRGTKSVIIWIVAFASWCSLLCLRILPLYNKFHNPLWYSSPSWYTLWIFGQSFHMSVLWPSIHSLRLVIPKKTRAIGLTAPAGTNFRQLFVVVLSSSVRQHKVYGSAPYLHTTSLDQTVVHCPIFLTAAPFGS